MAGVGPGSVGRKPRRAESVALSTREVRAGFEPFVAYLRAPFSVLIRLDSDRSARGSNPAHGDAASISEQAKRAEVFALPTWGMCRIIACR
jgi:hypothetical protein